MSNLVRKPLIRVSINGVQRLNALSAQCTFSFLQRVASAQVVFPSDPGASEGDWIEIAMGPTVAELRTRFAGYVMDVDTDLWPNAWALICAGTLIRAEIVKGEETDAAPNGIDLSNGGAGQTDQAMVQQVLERCGVPNLSIQGTGKVLGTVASDQFFWTSEQTGLSVIEDLDDISLGYRTFNAPSGACIRRQITANPASAAVYTFTEGQDIFRGQRNSTIRDVKNAIQVTGYDGRTVIVTQDSPFLLRGITEAAEPFGSPKIERELESDPGNGLSCEAVGKWRIGETNRKRRVVSFSTHRGELLTPGITIAVNASRLGGDDRYWLQEVTTRVDAEGFTQELVGVGGPGSSAPIDTLAPPLADFSIVIEIETVVIAGANATRYFVHCEDTSVPWGADITTRAWTATGGTPSSGSGTRFTTVYDDLTGKSISLQVTDAKGQTDTRTKTLTEAVPTNQRVVRRLFDAATVEAEAWDGSTWREDPPSVGSVTVVANGPLWAAGDRLLVSSDDLATSATESQPFGAGENITAIWIETDHSTSQVLIGSSAGRIGYSTDGGTSFTVKAGPSGSAVLRCIISRFVPGQFHVLTANAYFVSDNYGDGWRLVRAAASGQTFNDLALSHTRNVIASSVSGAGAPLERAEDGTPFTFPSLTPAVSNVLAVVGDIAEDRFYCYDSQGRTFVTDTSGGTAMSQGADLPDPSQPQVRGLWRDGAIKGLLYVANGTSGVYKSADGFASSGGYYQLRAPGVEGAHASADYTQVGADGLLKRREITETVIVSNTTDVVCLNLWNGSSNDAEPDGWRDVGFDDSAWAATAQSAAHNSPVAPPTGATVLWDDTLGIPANQPEKVLFRHVFALPGGIISSATIQISNEDTAMLWINNTFIYQDTQETAGDVEASHSPRSFTVDPSILRPGANNVIACWAKNINAGIQGIEGIAYRLEIR